VTAPDFTEIFRRIPLLAPLNPQAFVITPLCGLTNLNFHLRYQHHDYVLRIPKERSGHFIDRQVEAFNEDQIIRKGFAPQVIWREDSGLSLSRCIRHSRSLTKADFNDAPTIAFLLEKIKILHQSDIQFKGQTDIVTLLKNYAELPARGKSHITGDRLNKSLKIHQAIHAHDNRLVSSHNDLVLENLLIDDQSKLWFIDWEYSGLASPYWDLATVCNSARMDQPDVIKFLSLYDSPNSELRMEYLVGYQYMLQLLTIGWLASYSDDAVATELDWLHRLEMSVTGFFDRQQTYSR
jgi:thiamine kinase-like enzyme